MAEDRIQDQVRNDGLYSEVVKIGKIKAGWG